MIEIKNVSKWFGDFQVLVDIDEVVERGQKVVICGPSGSGKSTLLRCVNGLEPYQKGEILVDGVSLSDPKTNLYKLREKIGMVFQRFELYPHLTVMRNITLAPMKVRKQSRPAAEKKAMALLSAWASRTRPRPTRPTSRAASSSAWPLPGRSPWSPTA